MVSYNRTSGLNQSWNLSLVGDWNSVTTNGTAQSRTHGPTHELTVGAGQNVASDVKGNMTTIPAALRPNAAGLTMTWDFDNRLSSAVVSGGATVSQQYDALGRRVARTVGSSTTVFVQDGQQTVADYAAGAAPASSTYRYLYASYVDEPVMRWQTSGSTAVYYHRNQQYSVVALTDGSGTIVERYAYTAYGQPTFLTGSGTLLPDTAVANRYTYTGREWDGQVQLYHYRARMYDAGLGRFCSRDPIGFEGSKWGLYEYVHGRALVAVDPSGKRWVIKPAGQGICELKHRESPDRRVRANGSICFYECYCHKPGTWVDIDYAYNPRRPCNSPPPNPPECKKWEEEPDPETNPNPNPNPNPSPVGPIIGGPIPRTNPSPGIGGTNPSPGIGGTNTGPGIGGTILNIIRVPIFIITHPSVLCNGLPAGVS